jgi:NAD(P)-dependent dehydrogenase (short-subunit alcohol dehydrogenase family)
VSGRGVLVTGGSRGIGAAVARAFAAAGDRVAVHCRADVAGAEAVVRSLPGDGHRVLAADLADSDAVAAMVDDAVRGLGRVDVLVNNAALYDADAGAGGRRIRHRIDEAGYDEWRAAWRRTVEVNLLGTADVTWCVVRHMLDRGGGGRIVTVGSRGAYRGEPDVPAYGATKAAVQSLTQSLAVALAPHGIAAAAVAPGFVRTDMTAELLDGPEGAAIRAQSPFGRVGTPEEVAAAVVYLASADAEWASGAVLDLNGASYLR